MRFLRNLRTVAKSAATLEEQTQDGLPQGRVDLRCSTSMITKSLMIVDNELSTEV
jgi:hypothetical protein